MGKEVSNHHIFAFTEIDILLVSCNWTSHGPCILFLLELEINGTIPGL